MLCDGAMNATASPKTEPLGRYLLALTGLILILQMVIFAPKIYPIVSRLTAVTHENPIPWIIYPPLIWTAVMQIGLWLVLTGLLIIISNLLIRLFKISASKQLSFAAALWTVTVASIFLANQYRYPQSMFSHFTETFIPDALVPMLLIITLVILGMALLASLISLFRLNKAAANSIVILMAGLCVYSLLPSSPAQPGSKPNIIIIGLDSVRPDFVGYYHAKHKLTPKLDSFLTEATNFTNATTPFARTFPAWVSILTGRYPKEDGARYDLIDHKRLHLAPTLGAILQEAGYKTIYASDERRFSDIDESYGFNEIVSHPIGFNDFLHSIYNDFPLGNLLVNTRFGAWLFPYNYMNRSSTALYKPATFNDALRRALRNNTQQPLFLAVHFCLPHFPYVWADTPQNITKEPGFAGIRDLYAASIAGVDQQFGRLLQDLEQQKLLQNSLVIVVSDHGEALRYPGDRPLSTKLYQGGEIAQSAFFRYITHKTDMPLDTSKGHGTDVLSRSQHHVILAIRSYGKKANIPSRLDFPTSLIDIKATVLAWLGLPITDSSGISLANYLQNPQATPPDTRQFYFETGFSPDIVLSKEMTIISLLELGIRYYQIDPNTGKIAFRPNMTDEIIHAKQHGILFGDWYLGIYPTPSGDVAVALNMKTGEWTDKLNTTFTENTPLSSMLNALQSFYGNEISLE